MSESYAPVPLVPLNRKFPRTWGAFDQKHGLRCSVWFVWVTGKLKLSIGLQVALLVIGLVLALASPIESLRLAGVLLATVSVVMAITLGYVHVKAAQARRDRQDEVPQDPNTDT